MRETLHSHHEQYSGQQLWRISEVMNVGSVVSLTRVAGTVRQYRSTVISVTDITDESTTTRTTDHYNHYYYSYTGKLLVLVCHGRHNTVGRDWVSNYFHNNTFTSSHELTCVPCMCQGWELYHVLAQCATPRADTSHVVLHWLTELQTAMHQYS